MKDEEMEGGCVVFAMWIWNGVPYFVLEIVPGKHCCLFGTSDPECGPKAPK